MAVVAVAPDTKPLDNLRRLSAQSNLTQPQRGILSEPLLLEFVHVGGIGLEIGKQETLTACASVE